MAQAPLSTLIFHGSFGAYRKDGADWSVSANPKALKPPMSCRAVRLSGVWVTNWDDVWFGESQP
jgi:hypothetical protein